MRSVYRSLLWKEFHEHKWVAVAAAGVTLAVPLMYAPLDAVVGLERLVLALIWYPLVGGTFFGARAAAGERARGTAPFVGALPISPRWIGLVRIVVILLVALLPLVVLAVAGVLIERSIQPQAVRGSPVALIAGFCTALTIVWLLVVAVSGCGQPTEVRVAVGGPLAILVFGVVAFGLVNLSTSTMNALEDMQNAAQGGFGHWLPEMADWFALFFFWPAVALTISLGLTLLF